MKKIGLLAILSLLSCKQETKNETTTTTTQVSDTISITKPADSTKVIDLVKAEQEINILLPRGYRTYDKYNPANDLKKNWVELNVRNGNYSIEKAHYTIKNDFDECSGDSLKVIIPKNKTLLYLDSKKLSLGNITSLPIKKDKIWPKDKTSFSFNGTEYFLRAEGQVLSSEKVYSNDDKLELFQNVKNYKLYISTKDTPEKLLLKEESFNDTFVKLLFVGDIDKDGKLDFIFDASRDYEEERVLLFLSSPAKEGNLVEKVGEIEAQFDC
ncbi:hypothetical protein [Chryseobacterium sp.]|uniref:hypothetical protein n=1 Tax=Chryseobacterium sp. TaxID=1871047 RepID=UPI00388F8223